MSDGTREAEAIVLVAEPPASFPDIRPHLRGTLHGVVAVLAPIGLVVLLALANSPRGYVGAAVFATSMMLLYTTSASYHLAPWPRRARGIMMRLDHSMIFVLIAGTYTPFCIAAVGDSWGIPLLAIVWTLAALGVVLKVAWPRPPRWLTVSLYLGMGWLGAVAFWPLVNNVAPPYVALLAAGGLAYSVGSLIYATRWPDPLPRWFGFHEVFHAFVVAGTALHFVAISAVLAS